MTAYEKTTWADEVPESIPVKFNIYDENGTILYPNVTISPATVITTQGTPLNAENLNKIETGIETAQDSADGAQESADAAQDDVDALNTKIFGSAGAGKIPYFSSSSVLAKLALGAAGQTLRVANNGLVPAWNNLGRCALINKVGHTSNYASGDNVLAFENTVFDEMSMVLNSEIIFPTIGYYLVGASIAFTPIISAGSIKNKLSLIYNMSYSGVMSIASSELFVSDLNEHSLSVVSLVQCTTVGHSVKASLNAGAAGTYTGIASSFWAMFVR